MAGFFASVCVAVWVGICECSKNRPESGLGKSGKRRGSCHSHGIHTYSRAAGGLERYTDELFVVVAVVSFNRQLF